MSDPFIGDIRMFAGLRCPRGYSFCDGGLVQISQNQQLYSLIGAIYGGDARVTFGLPDFRGRIPIHRGAGFNVGERGGVEVVTLQNANMPTHHHSLYAAAQDGDSGDPEGRVLAKSAIYVEQDKMNADMSDSSIIQTGGNRPHENMQPYMPINFMIALKGTYPSRT